MREHIENLIAQAIKNAQVKGLLQEANLDDMGVERPQDPSNGDWTSTAALRSAKIFHKSPREISQIILDELPQSDLIEKVEIAGPGFINFYLSQLSQMNIVKVVREQGLNFARSDYGQHVKVNLEYVSANPVGPMHIGHGRWAALGDSLANIMEHVGFDMVREYYINDAGSQMDVFGRSIANRYLQLHELISSSGLSLEDAFKILEEDRGNYAAGEGEHPLHDEFMQKSGENSYGGDYIIKLAKDFYEAYQDDFVALDESKRVETLRELAYEKMMQEIKKTLKKARAHFDVYFSERELHKKDAQGVSDIDRAIQELDQLGYVEKRDGATYFLSTNFGDDKDRVLVKSDGAITYFAADVAYAKNKFDRGFDLISDIWGADHHGYIKRVDSACEAFGHKDQFEVILGQLVNLLRNGQPVRMSKRKGTMISFDELLEEVGVDAARYHLLSRSSDQEIDFDIELAKKKSSDNPVYYVQYAHARICSILKKAAFELKKVEVDPKSNDEMNALAQDLIGQELDLSLLTDESELNLARLISTYPEFLQSAARDRAPFRLTHFASSLASAFHQFYDRCQVISEHEELTRARLSLCDAVRVTLQLNLRLLGVSAPIKM